MARFQVQELARIHPYTYTIRFPNVTYEELGFFRDGEEEEEEEAEEEEAMPSFLPFSIRHWWPTSSILRP